jgi:hypothetical protein
MLYEPGRSIYKSAMTPFDPMQRLNGSASVVPANLPADPWRMSRRGFLLRGIGAVGLRPESAPPSTNPEHANRWTELGPAGIIDHAT